MHAEMRLSKTNVSVEESTTTMNDDRVVSIGSQSAPCDALTELLREKAVELLQAAVNAECADFLSRFAEQRDQVGRCALVRNGYLPARSIVTGIGPISVSVPRIRDRSGQGIRFESKARADVCAAREVGRCSAAVAISAGLS